MTRPQGRVHLSRSLLSSESSVRAYSIPVTIYNTYCWFENTSYGIQ